MNNSPVSSGLMFISLLIMTGVVFGTGMSIYNQVTGAMRDRELHDRDVWNTRIEVYNVSWNEGLQRIEIDVRNEGSTKLGHVDRFDVFVEGPLEHTTNMIGTWIPHESKDGIDTGANYWNMEFTSNNDKNPDHFDPGETIQVRVYLADAAISGAFRVAVSVPNGVQHVALLEV